MSQSVVDGAVTTAKLADGAVTSAKLDASIQNFIIPAGLVVAFAANAPPTGWLLCDGSAVSRTTYSNLFSTIGTTWGQGDGVMTFNLPDLRGRTLFDKSVSGTFATLGLDGLGILKRIVIN